MNNIKLLLISLLSLMLTLASCDKDNSPAGGDYKTGEFVNTWCSVGSDGEYTILKLSNTHYVSGTEATYNEGALTQVPLIGTWSYYASNNIIVIQTSFPESDGSITTLTSSYKVTELGNGRMILRNQDTGLNETFYRVAESITLSVGEKLSTLISTDGQYQTSDPYVISIENDLGPLAVGSGHAFLIVTDKSSSYVIECKVLHQTEVFSGYLGGSIEAIIDKYGEPDKSGMVGVNPAILYNHNLPDGISGLQIQYDATSSEVTRIICILYTSDAADE